MTKTLLALAVILGLVGSTSAETSNPRTSLRDHVRGARQPEPRGRFRGEDRRHGQIASLPIRGGPSRGGS